MNDSPWPRVPFFVANWALMLSIKIPTALSGFLVVPLLYPYRDTDYEDLPFWTRPWANPEDWEGRGNGTSSLPAWWIHRMGESFTSFYKYHAVRNPANGLRSFEWLDADIIPEGVRYRTNHLMDRYEPGVMRKEGIKTLWHFSWIGLRAGFQYYHLWEDDALQTPRHLNIKFGWRVEPRDATDATDNIGTRDASFATKFLFYRKG